MICTIFHLTELKAKVLHRSHRVMCVYLKVEASEVRLCQLGLTRHNLQKELHDIDQLNISGPVELHRGLRIFGRCRAGMTRMPLVEDCNKDVQST